MQNNISRPNSELSFAVVFGGKSSEHDAAVRRFEYLYKAYRDRYHTTRLRLNMSYFISREGHNVLITPIDITQPADYYYQSNGRKYVSLFDAVRLMIERKEFIFLQYPGQFGEDGCFQGIAHTFGIPGDFGTVLSGSLSMSKFHMLRFISNNYHPIRTPETLRIFNEKDIDRAIRQFEGREVVIKPNTLGSSLFTEKFLCIPDAKKQLSDHLQNILEYDDFALIQAYILGKEYTCYCLERQGKIDILGVKLFETPDHFLGNKQKFMMNQGLSQRFIRGDEEQSQPVSIIKTFSKNLFFDVGFQQMCRMDFIVDETDAVYFLEANSKPNIKGFTEALKEKDNNPSYTVLDMVEILIANEAGRPTKKTTVHYSVEYPL